MTKFTKTTEARYWEMLEVLPPAIMANGGFLVGEASDHNSQGRPRFAAFFEYPRGTFYESVEPMTVGEFRAVKPGDLSQ